MTESPGRSGEETTGEGDESVASAADGHPGDNSVGRLLALSDGVFGIAMTLLALDLVVPDSADHVSDQALRHLLAQNIPSYLSFLISFYVVAGYWSRHRRVMRSVLAADPKLQRDNIFLLLLIAAMPFPASLLGRFASDGSALALYGIFNLLCTLTLIQLTRDVQKQRLAAGASDHVVTSDERSETWGNAVVFLLCIPAGYLFGSLGPFVLLLLVVAGRGPSLRKLLIRMRSRRGGRHELQI